MTCLYAAWRNAKSYLQPVPASGAIVLLIPTLHCRTPRRKEVWAQLRSEALVALKRDLYAPMTAAEARLTLESRQLGVSRLRLIPKSRGAC